MGPNIDLPTSVDNVIIGGGPSALILSYLLHGHVPVYMGNHPDALLHRKLIKEPDLLSVSPELCDHFEASLRYSTSALPINTLLDTLLRPFADTGVDRPSCIQWEYRPRRAVSHVVLADASRAGGQWASDSEGASEDIEALSYAEQLSLPGYSFADHYAARHDGQGMPKYQRPSRAQVADYYSTYPNAAGIADSIHHSTRVSNVSRHKDGFTVQPQNIRCKHLVLATGTFSTYRRPPHSLEPLLSLAAPEEPLLVVGSGFSAADVIISTPPQRNILHIFRWDPENRPSPLKGCHRQAYPEYAEVYRRMKLAATQTSGGTAKPRGTHSTSLGKTSAQLVDKREWIVSYEGLVNADVVSVERSHSRMATLRFRTCSGTITERRVGGLAYMAGRRGSLSYLDPDLLDEVLSSEKDDVAALVSEDVVPGRESLVSGQTLRQKTEDDLQVAPSVFVAGSLTGDSLVRHVYGGCTYIAGKIMQDSQNLQSHKHPDCGVWATMHPLSDDADSSADSPSTSTPNTSCTSSCMASPQLPPQTMNRRPGSGGSTHENLYLDRRTRDAGTSSECICR